MGIMLRCLGIVLISFTLLMWQRLAVAADLCDGASVSNATEYPTECATTTSCCNTCCRAVSFPKTEQIEEKETCRIVKCEKVAVPAITLPWEQGGSPLTLFSCLRHLTQSNATKGQCGECCVAAECCDACGCDERNRSNCGLCGPIRCGTVRLVNVLDEEETKVKKCETTWEVGCVPACGRCGHCPHCCK